MKYNININQLVLSEYKELDVIDGAILDFLHHICSSTDPAISGNRIVSDNKIFTWVNLDYLLKEMPLLRINSSGALSRRFLKIINSGLIETIREVHQRLFVCLTPEFDKLLTNINSYPKAIDINQQSYCSTSTNNTMIDNNKSNKSTYYQKKETSPITSNEIPSPETPAQSAKRLLQDKVFGVFSQWLLVGPVKHKELTEKMVRQIEKRLKAGYTVEELNRAILNYSNILENPNSFFKYKWNLDDFIARGLEKFIDEQICNSNFIRKTNRNFGDLHEE